jgi:N-acetylglucosamine kinase-like BadF-type ATPase
VGAGRTVLAVDAGQSGSRMLLRAADGVEVSWRGPGIPAGTTPLAAMTGELLDAAVRGVRDAGAAAPEVVAAGLTGFHGGATGAEQASQAWRAALGTRVVRLTDDAVTSYLGALGDRSGAVVAAGTGVAVLASRDAASARVDGWGPVLGDDGGGHWVGQQGLRSAFRRLDGRGGSERLAAAARDAFGELTRLPGVLAASADRVAMVASFSRAVATAAREGDADACAIWASAGEALGRSVLAALDRVGRDPGGAGSATVSWTGSLFDAGDLLLEPFRRTVLAGRGDVRLHEPCSDSLHGALGLGLDQTARFRDLIDTATIG